MKTWIKFFWNTVICRRVSFNPDGAPIDCAGLRFKGKEPFGEDTTYYLTNSYIGFDYVGEGIYFTRRGFITDTRNPYWKEKFNKTLRDFNKQWEKRNV